MTYIPVPCAVCGVPKAKHGTAPTCATHDYTTAPQPLSFARLMELSYKAGCGVEHYGGDIAAPLERFARAIEAAHGVKGGGA